MDCFQSLLIEINVNSFSFCGFGINLGFSLISSVRPTLSFLGLQQSLAFLKPLQVKEYHSLCVCDWCVCVCVCH